MRTCARRSATRSSRHRQWRATSRGRGHARSGPCGRFVCGLVACARRKARASAGSLSNFARAAAAENLRAARRAATKALTWPTSAPAIVARSRSSVRSQRCITVSTSTLLGSFSSRRSACESPTFAAVIAPVSTRPPPPSPSLRSARSASSGTRRGATRRRRAARLHRRRRPVGAARRRRQQLLSQVHRDRGAPPCRRRGRGRGGCRRAASRRGARTRPRPSSRGRRRRTRARHRGVSSAAELRAKKEGA